MSPIPGYLSFVWFDAESHRGLGYYSFPPLPELTLLRWARYYVSCMNNNKGDHMDIDRWRLLFNEVNDRCLLTGESYVPYSDIDYYTEQIHSLTDESDYEAARAIAERLCDSDSITKHNQQ